MIRTTLVSLVGAAVAVLVAVRLGGVQGGGVLAGFFGGAGITGLGLLYQRHALLHRPKQAFTAMGVAFLAKLLLLMLGVLAFRFVEAAAVRVDWQTFLLAYAGSVAVLLPFGVWDLSRTPRTQDSPAAVAPAAVAPAAEPTADRSSTSEAPCGSS